MNELAPGRLFPCLAQSALSKWAVPLAPRVVFEDFSPHVARFAALRDAEIEDHLFDRKEIPVPPPGSNVSQNFLRDTKQQIRETISAFANTNPEGGLLLIGISKTGCVVRVNERTPWFL